MDDKTKIVFNGQLVVATRIPINHTEEQWSQYILADQTVLRMKVIVLEIYRIDDLYDGDGNPVYHIKSTSVASAVPPADLKRVPGGQL